MFLALAILLHRQTADLTSDPHLNARGSFCLLNVPASKLVSQLLGLVHKSVEVAGPLASRRVTRVGKDQSARSVMRALSSLTFGDWTRNARGYTLRMSSD